MSARVSVIVPVFDGERFLAEALESVFAQDHRPIEVIVVDDGSTDRSSGIARSFHEVSLVRFEENRGQAAARNAGLERATGEFVTFLDADDVMAPDRLSTQVGHLVRHPDVDCVIMKQELLLEDGMEVPSWLHPKHAPEQLVEGHVMSAMIRREAIGRDRWFDPAYRAGEELDWLFRLRQAGVRIEVLDRVGIRRRIHRGNMSHRPGVVGSPLLEAVRDSIGRRRGGPAMRTDAPGGDR